MLSTCQPSRFWNGMLARSTMEAVMVWIPVITKFPTVDTKVINPFISPNIVLDIVWMIGTITRAPNSTILPNRYIVIALYTYKKLDLCYLFLYFISYKLLIL